MVAARPTWMHAPMQESTQTYRMSALPGGQERTSLFPLGLYLLGLGRDLVLFQKHRSTSQAFLGFEWVYLLTNRFHPHARLTGLFGQTPDFAPFSVLLHLSLPSPAPTCQSGMRARKRGVLIFWTEHKAVISWSMKLLLPGEANMFLHPIIFRINV